MEFQVCLLLVKVVLLGLILSVHSQEIGSIDFGGLNLTSVDSFSLSELLEIDLQKISPLYSFPTPIPEADFEFAFFKNELYIKPLNHQTSEYRGSMTRLALYILSQKHSIPNVVAGITNIHKDLPTDQAPADAPLFSFSRQRGKSSPALLWPDYDFFGWPSNWIAPYDMITEAFNKSMKGWDTRIPKAFYSGRNLSKFRQNIFDCAKGNPEIIEALDVNWSDNGVNKDGHMHKSPKYDLRRMISYQFVLYAPGVIGWSSSLKRMMASGAVMLIPWPVEFEDLVMNALIRSGAYIPLDATNICEGIAQVISSSNTSEYNIKMLGLIANQTLEISQYKLSNVEVEDYMKRALVGLSHLQRNQLMNPRSLMKHGFIKYDCARIIKEILSGSYGWQVGYWYDTSTCMPHYEQYLENDSV